MTTSRRQVLLRATIAAGAGFAGALDSVAWAQARRTEIAGAGATFPAPLYHKWIEAFRQQHPEIAIAYEAVGSGEGVSRLINGSVTFAGSDAAMSDEQIAKVAAGVRMIPATSGLVAIVYNLPGIGAPLRIPREALPAIFDGQITSWSDPVLVSANPGLDLPDRTIARVVRLESSGTTFALTNHLSAVSQIWRARHGAANLMDWPAGAMVARGNEGVAARVQITEDSIGYVQHGFAQRLGLQVAELQNASGAFVAPTTGSGVAALAGSAAEMPDNLRVFIADPAGPDAYPVVSYSWILLYGDYADQQIKAAVTEFVRFGLTEGQQYAEDLGYVPLPEIVAHRAIAALGGMS